MAQAKVIIKAEDNITKAVNSAKNSLSSLEGAAVKMGSVLKNALGFTAVMASVKQLGDALYGCFSDFEEADRKYRQLEIALGGGEAFSRAKDSIADLSRQTLESKDSIETMVAELAALGKSSDDIERISKAAVYLSNVTGRLTEALLSLSDRFADKTEDNTVEWREITKKFAALLSPEIERWEKESGETIGEKLASWTAKSGDEYLDASKKSFASIGKTLTEWDVSFKDEIISELDALWGIVRPI